MSLFRYVERDWFWGTLLVGAVAPATAFGSARSRDLPTPHPPNRLSSAPLVHTMLTKK